MPALYKGSKEDLLKAENPEKEANINFQGKNLSELFESLRVTFPDACIVTRTVVQYRYNKWR